MSLALQIQGLLTIATAKRNALTVRKASAGSNSLLMQQRHEAIYDIMSDGKYRVPRDFASRFDVSERTIRNHFNRMGCRQSKVGEIVYYALPR